MNLHRLLLGRAQANRPVQVGVIGCGKFASMFFAQSIRTPGLEVVSICDLDPQRAGHALQVAGWSDQQIAKMRITDNAAALIGDDRLEVIVEATGHPIAGIDHALAVINRGVHLVMVNVEADALVGPWLANKAREAGIVYSLAYGDQPALIAEQVDWARACGFDVVCAGKGTRYLPSYHASTPDTVWDHYGLTAEQAKAGGMNPRMFNSFLDGTKSAIEMAAVVNATGLIPPAGGLTFPPCSADALADHLKPRSDGGLLEADGTVEVVSSLNRDGSAVHNDLRWGVYVVIRAAHEYVARCFSEYGLSSDPTGRYAALYRPTHMIGLELGISIASAALRHEPTGAPQRFCADVVAIAKRDLAAGDELDGEGGYTVWGRLTSAADSLRNGWLPIGMAAGIKLKCDVALGQAITWADVEVDETSPAWRIRREMEKSASG